MARFFNIGYEKKMKCKHENLYENYCVEFPCSTPYCSGYEVHCRDCGAYISTCKCGHNNGISKWSHKRWKAEYEKKNKKKNCDIQS